ncbi:hypothetical protein DL93DRAFT_2125393 [Clavulina sp. PMI_390]|nr:hypothetical protein DL93DRAFT_2125393 [Clavulina sp. PMI_390]
MNLFEGGGRDGSKSIKFPKDLLAVLDSKLENISMNRDPAYTEQLLRRSVAVFWGNRLKDPTFYRTMKENRKIEELIVNFISSAATSLQKSKELEGDAWKYELYVHIAQFIKILRECLRLVSHVPPELTAKMESYAEHLAPATEARNEVSPSTSNGAGPSGAVIFSSVSEMPMVKTVAKIFGYTLQEVQQDLSSLRKLCTTKAAVTDLKTCLKNIKIDAPFPGRREDFDTDEAWEHWKHNEVSELSTLLNDMVVQDPELARTTDRQLPRTNSPRPQSTYSFRDNADDGAISRRTSAASRYSLALSSFPPDDGDGMDAEAQTSSFTYIPSNSKRFYKRLMELCIEHDLRAMYELDGDEEVSLEIISSETRRMVDECALRWRVANPYRVTTALDIMKYKFEREEIPFACIPEAMQSVANAAGDLPLDDWSKEDAAYLTKVYGELFNIFLGGLYHSFENLENIKPDEINPAVQIIESIRDTGLLDRIPDFKIEDRFNDLGNRVRAAAAQQYSLKVQELFAAQVGVNRAIPLLLLTDWIEKQAKVFDSRFPDPLFGTLDLVGLVIENYVPLFLNDLETARRRLLEGSANQPTPDIPTQDLFALYRRTKSMLALLKAFCPQLHEDFDLAGYFRPYVQQWLVSTDNMTGTWVKNALAEDQFEAVGEEGHSSSIVDLFEFMKPPIDFLLELEWTDQYEEARFLTSLSKTISKCIEQYCRTVEELFMTEMYPRAAPTAPTASRNFIERARLLTIAGEAPAEPFNFSATSCVKLNNIEAARKLLDQLYVRIDADKVAETLDSAPPIPNKNEKERFLFTVKIISAENLPPNDSTSKLDSFVTLSDERGVRYAKTRTIYESLNPRWEETFDFSIVSSLWLLASVRDRALIGKHDIIGHASLHLDPARFGDFLAHDMWLNMDPAGRIMIRVSMEGEQEDIQFFFGRAFRSLKRTEGDMARIFIDKMRPIIQQTLSRKVIQTLIKSGLGPTYNKLRDYYKQAWGPSASEPLIPLPADEKPKFRPEQLSDEEVTQAIAPLFDYFETNVKVLNDYLSKTTREMVMLKVWKELLVVIDALLLPPLSAEPTDVKALSEKEVDIVFKWLKELRAFFYAEGSGPVPIEDLQNQKYRDIMSVRLYYDWHTDALMEECVRMMQQSLRAAPTIKQRAKSIKAQRNLGTIKDRKKEKRKEGDSSNGEIIMRILRMRPRTSDFIAQQLAIMNAVKSEREARAKGRLGQSNHVSRPSRSPIPPVPSIPR